MPTKRIGDLPIEEPCTNQGHRPPSQIVLQPGVYEHTCPGCGQSFTFVVPSGPRWFVDRLGHGRRTRTVLITPAGTAWPIDKIDAPLAEWACDILNAGEIK